MAKIWFTYAWSDNSDQDVDVVIRELQAKGLDVRFDRAQLLAGGRLWAQLDAAIGDSDLEGLVLFTTENSLKSEPCQEELSYALDRVLRATAERPFKLIGLFPRPLDRAIVPSALATRLYVNLIDHTWAQQISDAFAGERTPPDLSAALPYGHKWHWFDGKPVLEIWPRTGRWLPTAVLIPPEDAVAKPMLMPGDRDFVTMSGMVQGGDITAANGWIGFACQNPITAIQPAHIMFQSLPSRILVRAQDQMFEIATRP